MPTDKLIAVTLVGLVLLTGCRLDRAPTVDDPMHETEDPVMPDTLAAEPMDDPYEPPSADVQAVQQHALTVEEVRRYGRAFENVHEVVTTDPDAQRLQGLLEAEVADAQTIAQAQQILNEHPRLREAIERAGISTEDYVLTASALYGAYSYVIMREQGVPEPFRPDYVTDAHIQFIVDNRQEVERVIERIAELYGEDID
jgi:hypothetical protein